MLKVTISSISYVSWFFLIILNFLNHRTVYKLAERQRRGDILLKETSKPFVPVSSLFLQWVIRTGLLWLSMTNAVSYLHRETIYTVSWVSSHKLTPFLRRASCHVGQTEHNGAHFITKVKQHWAGIVPGWVTQASTQGGVWRWFRILWPGARFTNC
jgi:hypothetical protein